MALDGSVEEECGGECDHGHLQQVLKAEKVPTRCDTTLQGLSEGQYGQKERQCIPQDRDIISKVH